MSYKYFVFTDGRISRATASTESLYDSPLWQKVSAAKGKALYREQCGVELTTTLQDAAGSKNSLTIYTVIRSVSASGMSRVFDMYVVLNGEVLCITYPISVVLDMKLHKDRGVVVPGSGMDLRYHVVESLFRSLGLLRKIEFHLTTL